MLFISRERNIKFVLVQTKTRFGENGFFIWGLAEVYLTSSTVTVLVVSTISAGS